MEEGGVRMKCVKCGIEMLAGDGKVVCGKCGKIVASPTVYPWPDKKPFLMCLQCGSALHYLGKKDRYVCLDPDCTVNDYDYVAQRIYAYVCHSCKGGLVDSRISRKADHPEDGFCCTACGADLKEWHIQRALNGIPDTRGQALIMQRERDRQTTILTAEYSHLFGS